MNQAAAWWYVRLTQSPPVWPTLSGVRHGPQYLPRVGDLCGLLPRPTTSHRHYSLPAALDHARKSLAWLNADLAYSMSAEVLDHQFHQVHVFESFPVRVPVTTRTLFALANIQHS